MTRIMVVEDHNQDDLSRKAGCYLYVDTKLWFDNNLLHRDDGPAVIFPDGVGRWYLRGKEVTREVKTYFIENHWPIERGLDTPEKRAQFSSHFLK